MDNTRKYNRLKAVLAEESITQDQLALKTGLHRQTISKICRNVNQPTIRRLYQLAEAIGVSAKDLLV